MQVWPPSGSIFVAKGEISGVRVRVGSCDVPQYRLYGAIKARVAPPIVLSSPIVVHLSTLHCRRCIPLYSCSLLLLKLRKSSLSDVVNPKL
jgi:hypothetical protein